jgi:hypothetical protein
MAHILWVHITIGDINMPCHLQDYNLWECPTSLLAKVSKAEVVNSCRPSIEDPFGTFLNHWIKQWKEGISTSTGITLGELNNWRVVIYRSPRVLKSRQP